MQKWTWNILISKQEWVFKCERAKSAAIKACSVRESENSESEEGNYQNRCYVRSEN
jgi:hypothetical protein